MSERRKILDMLAAGQVTPDEAEELLSALGPAEAPPAARAPKAAARLLRIHVDAEGEAKIRVNVPLALAKFATKFIPKEAQGQLELQGIDLAELIDSLKDEVPEGKLVDIDAVDEGRNVKITIEVV